MMQLLIERETWKLWWWAVSCPSQLQQQMNDRFFSKTDVNFATILLFPEDGQLLKRFFSLVCLFSLPLAGLLTKSPFLTDWWLLPITLFVSYMVALFFLPVAIHIPIIIAFFYVHENQAFREVVQARWLGLEQLFPSFSQVLAGIGIGSFLLGLTSVLIYSFLERQNFKIARLFFAIGTAVSATVGVWISTKSIEFAAIVGLWCITPSFSSRSSRKLAQGEHDVGNVANDIASDVAFNIVGIVTVCVIASTFTAGISGIISAIISFVITISLAPLIVYVFAVFSALSIAAFIAPVAADDIAIFIASFVASFLATSTGIAVVVFVTLGIAGGGVIISNIALLPFLAAAAVLAFSLSYRQSPWLGIFITAGLVALGVKSLGWQVLWVLPVSLGFYYRLLLDYIVFAAILMVPRLKFQSSVSQQDLSTKNLEQQLKRLPPFSSELLWLPLPGHAQLLTEVFQRNHSLVLPKTFQQNSNLALSTLKKMQKSPLLGLNHTAKRTLTDIVADQLLKFNTVAQLHCLLLETANNESNNILKTLLPIYYDPNPFNVSNNHQVISIELSIIFPHLRSISQNVESALQAEHITLRQRGLERVIDQLKQLSGQLPGLGLKANSIRRWQPVLTRWQYLLELELVKQNS